MNRDPDRWLADSTADPQMTELLRSALPPLDLPVAIQTRVGTALQQLANGPAGASIAVAAKPAVSSALAAKTWLGVSTVALAALIGGLVLQRLDASPRAVPPTTAEQSPVRKPVVSQPIATVSELPLVLEPALGTAAGTAPVKLRSHPTAPKPASGLAEEARLLEATRASLSTDPAAARRTLTLYDAKFPNGALKQERSLLAVKLAVAEGRRSEANAQALELEQSAKGSPFAKKAREVVDSNERAKTSRTINQ